MYRKSTRKVGHPPLTFKNTLKDILKRGGVLDTWKETVADRPIWRKLISDVYAKINSKRHDKRTLKEKKEMNFELIDIIYQKYLSFIYLSVHRVLGNSDHCVLCIFPVSGLLRI